MNVIYLLYANPYTNMVTKGLSPGEYVDQRANAQVNIDNENKITIYIVFVVLHIKPKQKH
jgi:hypothetical protein